MNSIYKSRIPIYAAYYSDYDFKRVIKTKNHFNCIDCTNNVIYFTNFENEGDFHYYEMYQYKNSIVWIMRIGYFK